MNDNDFMGEALRLAGCAAERGEVPVGAVVVCDGQIVGTGFNRRETGKNALAHAELEAIDAACRRLGGWRLHRCELYVTLEPCPMCAGAIINARIRRLVFGARDPKSGCFCCMFGGSLLDCLGAFFTGFILYAYVLKLYTPHLSKIIGNIGGGALVTVLCMFLCRIGLGESMNYMIIGSIMPLIPGIAFTNGVRDIADGDYIAGSVRLLDAILVFVCIAAGVGLVITTYHGLTGGRLL